MFVHNISFPFHHFMSSIFSFCLRSYYCFWRRVL